jgi:hypothetical protein
VPTAHAAMPLPSPNRPMQVHTCAGPRV